MLLTVSLHQRRDKVENGQFVDINGFLKPWNDYVNCTQKVEVEQHMLWNPGKAKEKKHCFKGHTHQILEIECSAVLHMQWLTPFKQ